MNLKEKTAISATIILLLLVLLPPLVAQAPQNRFERAADGSWGVIIRNSDGEWIQAWGTVPPTPTSPAVTGTQYRNNLDKKTYRWTGSAWVLANTWSLSTIDSQVFTLPCCDPVVSANTISATGIVFHVSTGVNTLRTINILQVGTILTLIFDVAITIEDNTGNLDLAGTFNAVANDTLTLASDGIKWYEVGRSTNTSGGGIPAGSIIMTLTSCPSGFSQVTSLDGRFALGTLAAHANVGTTGGADDITPAGTNGTVSFTPAGTNAAITAGTPAGTNSAPTFTGNALATHTHTFTGNAVSAASTSATPDLVTSNTAGSGVSPVTTATGTNAAITAGTPAGTVSAPTFTGSALATHNHTFTGSSGTVPAEAFTGTQFDNRSAFVRVIFCSKD